MDEATTEKGEHISTHPNTDEIAQSSKKCSETNYRSILPKQAMIPKRSKDSREPKVPSRILSNEYGNQTYRSNKETPVK